MNCKVIVDHQASATIDRTSPTIAQKITGFPWVRFDAETFIREEALYNGNYLNVHHSAMGRSHTRGKIHALQTQTLSDWGDWAKTMPSLFPREQQMAFQLEVNGQLLRDHWEWGSDRVVEHADGTMESIIELVYSAMPVTVGVHTKLDGTRFQERWLEIENTGKVDIALSRVFPWCGLFYEDNDLTITTADSGPAFTLGRFKHSVWAMEGEFAWEPLPEGTLKIEHTRKLFNPPMYAVRNESSGELTLLHFEWSGNVTAEFTRLSPPITSRYRHPWGQQYLHAKLGLAGPAPHRFVLPGQKVRTPSIHLSMMYGSMDDAVNQLHRHLRRSVIPAQPAGSEHLVQYNHWGSNGGHAPVSPERLINEIDVAASVGAELFMVDAGWFGSDQKYWMSNVGDWYENPHLNGRLSEIYDYARAKGMKCGLWMEIERASFSSELAKKHDDWYIRLGQRKLEMLDVSKPDVEQYLTDTICRVIEHYRLDCFRLDHNYDQATGGEALTEHGIENSMWKYFEGLYRVFERVRNRYPGTLLENCSSGGGRLDLGMMRRFHYTQMTDNAHPVEQLRILNGLTLALPPETCMSWAGVGMNTYPADPDFAIRAGMFGHLNLSGVDLSVEKTNDTGLKSWKRGVELYKTFLRPFLSDCRVFHHTERQDYLHKGDWVVLEYASADASRAAVGLFRLHQAKEGEPFQLKLRGLDVSRTYRVLFDNAGRAVTLTGYELSVRGIPVELPGPMTSELLMIEELATSCDGGGPVANAREDQIP